MPNFDTLIDPLHHEDLRNPLHPSIFDENEGYDMLIVRLPVLGETLSTQSLGFVFLEGESYFYDKDAGAFTLLEQHFDGVYRKLDRLIDRLLKSFQSYQDGIADMEEQLYADSPEATFMTRWLGFKRDVVRIERILERTSQTMEGVIAYYEEREAFPVNKFVDLHEHLERISRSATLQLSKLDYLYNFYNARTSEKMNKMVYLLTIISAVFLPLNLVVGFFGMNTSGLPFSEGNLGTVSAVSLMISLMIITSIVVYSWRRKVEG